MAPEDINRTVDADSDEWGRSAAAQTNILCMLVDEDRLPEIRFELLLRPVYEAAFKAVLRDAVLRDKGSERAGRVIEESLA